MENIFLKKARTYSSIQTGFTLLEVLIVIAIIGILVSLGVVSYSSAQAKSRDSRRRGDIKAVQSAWEQYYGDNNGTYPSTCSVDMSTYLPAGIASVVDPKNSGTYVYDFSDSHCSPTSYCFCAHLESSVGNAADVSAGATCTFGAGDYYCLGSLQ